MEELEKRFSIFPQVEIDIEDFDYEGYILDIGLDVLIDASGSVYYYGSPNVNSTISGSGDVNRLGNK
jgi:hypothetical protein